MTVAPTIATMMSSAPVSGTTGIAKPRATAAGSGCSAETRYT